MRNPGPRVVIEDASAPKLEPPELMPVAAGDATPRPGGAGFALAGVAVLLVGLAALQTGNFAAAQFERAAWLGWLTVGVAAGGFGLLAAGLWRELRGLFALARVDRLRAAFTSREGSRVHAAARQWVATLPEAETLRPAIDAANDPDAIVALLRAGPDAELRSRADALGRTAAFQMAAGIAATPTPSLAALLIAWRGVRLVRQVAALYGMRPGLVGTLGLLRRTMLAAGLVAGSEARDQRRGACGAHQPAVGACLGRDGGRGRGRATDHPAGPRHRRRLPARCRRSERTIGFHRGADVSIVVQAQE